MIPVCAAPDPRWTAAGWGYKVSSLDELTRAIGRVGTLQVGRRFVWRGVADARWRVRSSLYRMLAQEDPTRAEPLTEAELRARERALLREARHWGLGLRSGTLMNDMELLATLQHHGIPTRLLDVTSNPMTALWFACQRAGDRDAAGALFAFDVADVVEYATLEAQVATWGSAGDPLGWPLRGPLQQSAISGLPFLVRPSVPDARMQAQEGLFIAGAAPATPSLKGVDGLPLRVGEPPQEKLGALFAVEDRRVGRPVRVPFLVLVVAPALKQRMLPHLEATYNRNQRVLFRTSPACWTRSGRSCSISRTPRPRKSCKGARSWSACQGMPCHAGCQRAQRLGPTVPRQELGATAAPATTRAPNSSHHAGLKSCRRPISAPAERPTPKLGPFSHSSSAVANIRVSAWEVDGLHPEDLSAQSSPP